MYKNIQSDCSSNRLANRTFSYFCCAFYFLLLYFLLAKKFPFCYLDVKRNKEQKKKEINSKKFDDCCFQFVPSGQIFCRHLFELNAIFFLRLNKLFCSVISMNVEFSVRATGWKEVFPSCPQGLNVYKRVLCIVLFFWCRGEILFISNV